jgi:hypothetical protein
MSEVTAIIIHPDQVLHHHATLTHEGLRQLIGGDIQVSIIGYEELPTALAWLRDDGVGLPENRVASALLQAAGSGDWINGTLVVTGDADTASLSPVAVDEAWVAEFPEEVFG